MAKLTSAQRNALPSNDFVFPAARKFPIPNKSHAINALSRAAAQGGGVQAKVRAKVKAKFPTISKKPTQFGHPTMNNHKMAGHSAAASSLRTPAHLRPHQARLAGTPPPASPLEDPMDDTALDHISDQQVEMDKRKKAKIKRPAPPQMGALYGM